MSNEIERAHVGAGVTATQGIGGASLAKSGETSAIAVAEAAKANVLARFQMARLEPRDQDTARVRILKDCERPRFAELASYELPRGGKTITGPSIRLAEVCARAWGNVGVEAVILFEDEEKRIVRVQATDYETNATYSTDVTVTKVVERSTVRDAGDIVGHRTNSQGKPVYLVRANETDLLAKHNALVSKARRNVIFCIVPGDIVDEALEVAAKTTHDRDAKDPDAERRRVVDGFMKINVEPAQLSELLGHPVAQSTPAEVGQLRRWYAAIRDGETTVAQLVAERTKATAPATAEPAASTASSKTAAAVAALVGDPKPATKPAMSAAERKAAKDRGEDPDA